MSLSVTVAVALVCTSGMQIESAVTMQPGQFECAVVHIQLVVDLAASRSTSFFLSASFLNSSNAASSLLVR